VAAWPCDDGDVYGGAQRPHDRRLSDESAQSSSGQTAAGRIEASRRACVEILRESTQPLTTSNHNQQGAGAKIGVNLAKR